MNNIKQEIAVTHNGLAAGVERCFTANDISVVSFKNKQDGNHASFVEFRSNVWLVLSRELIAAVGDSGSDLWVCGERVVWNWGRISPAILRLEGCRIAMVKDVDMAVKKLAPVLDLYARM